MSSEDFPWFAEARLSDVFHVELLRGHHLHWPALDVDLEIDSCENLTAYPLVAVR